ncbi:MAG: alanine/glycine:cation symporter family protein [Saprospiraceae bacterium]
MAWLDQILSQFSSLAWGLPLLILLLGGGLYLGFISGFATLRLTGLAIKQLFQSTKTDGDILENTISPFQALSTALASTIGMGNIAGVAVAISIGGPGAIFWMWVSALIGMITKFFTCSLAVMFRKTNEDGTVLGGPMYFIEIGLGPKWKPLAMSFALFGLVGAFPVFNVNQLTQAVRDIVLIPSGFEVGLTSNVIIGILLTVMTSLVILGGLQRIGKTSEKFVPAMVVLYFVCVLYIIVGNIQQLPETIGLIFSEAFMPTHFKGSPFLGGTLGGLILLGIKRGAFSNEAGIGTADLAHGASSQKEPLREGLSAMLGPLIDTLVVCTLTALAILITGVWKSTGASGVTLTLMAFEAGIPHIGSYLLMACIAVFSFSSLFSFSFYGTQCTSYLFGKQKAHYYQYIYLASILIGAITTLDMMINLIDGFYALMAIPTMTGTILLAPHVVKRLKKVDLSKSS